MTDREKFEKIARLISREEYEMLKKQLADRNCHTCRNASCRVEHYEKPVEECPAWINDEYVGKMKVLKSSKKFSI